MRTPQGADYWRARRKRHRESGVPLQGKKKSARVDLGLALLARVAMPGVRYSYDEIAAFCGCTDAAIYQIERRAIAKLREQLNVHADRRLVEMIEGLFDSREVARRSCGLKRLEVA